MSEVICYLHCQLQYCQASPVGALPSGFDVSTNHVTPYSRDESSERSEALAWAVAAGKHRQVLVVTIPPDSLCLLSQYLALYHINFGRRWTSEQEY